MVITCVKKNNNEELFKRLVESGEVVVGIDEGLVNNRAEVFKELQTIVEKKQMYVFQNNKGRSQRAPIANSRLGNANCYVHEKFLSDHCPNLHNYVQRVKKAYQKSKKTLSALWWTYYRDEVGRTEVVWVKLGKMNPHPDKLGGKFYCSFRTILYIKKLTSHARLILDPFLKIGATDRVIASLGVNTKGGQKRMSFHLKKKKDEKAWLDIYHGMFICLSQQGSGSKMNQQEKDFVWHGIEGAQGTWTVTMEFA